MLEEFFTPIEQAIQETREDVRQTKESVASTFESIRILEKATELLARQQQLTMSQKSERMPRPLSSEAPRWDGRDADSLREFLYQLEILFDTCNVTSYADQMKYALSYLTMPTRVEWMGFPEYSAPNMTWEKFKERLKKEYPELVISEQGSLRELNRICDQYRPIMLGEEDRLLAFKRRFTIEANKCTKDPAIISNRELVDKFIQTLDDEFRNLLDQRLALIGGQRTDAQGKAINSADLREEDPYDWTEVANAAVKLITGKTLHRSLQRRNSRETLATNRGSSGRTTQSTGATGQVVTKRELTEVTESLSSNLAQDIANLKDMITVQEKNIKSYVDSLKGNTSGNRPMYQPPREANNGAPAYRTGCFYCGRDGHGWLYCPAKEEDAQKGRIIIDGARVMWADRTLIPRGEVPIRKRVLEKYGLSEDIISSNMYQQPPLEMPQGLIDVSQVREPEFVQYMSRINEARDATLAKEAEMSELKQRMGSLESALRNMMNVRSREEPGQPVPSILKRKDDTADQLTELSRQIAALQGQLAKRSEVRFENDTEQYMETRANKGPGF